MSSAEVLIHVTFAPNATVTYITEQPAEVTPDDWFDFLTVKIGLQFQALSGGRGMFRSDRAAIDEYKVAVVGAVAAAKAAKAAAEAAAVAAAPAPAAAPAVTPPAEIAPVAAAPEAPAAAAPEAPAAATPV